MFYGPGGSFFKKRPLAAGGKKTMVCPAITNYKSHFFSESAVEKNELR